MDKEPNREIEQLKEKNEALENHKVILQQVKDSVNKELEELKQENQRLKGLIEKSWNASLDYHYNSEEPSLHQFKIINNI